MSESTAVATTKPEPMRLALARYKESVAPMVLKGQDVDRLFSMAMMQINGDDKLKQCTLPSIATAIGRIATWGLEPGLTAHLVPYKNNRKGVYECTAIADYKGYVQLMRDAGARDVDAQVVREGDQFDVQLGTGAYIKHRPLFGKNRKITHAYAVVRLPHNVEKFEIIEYDEIDAMRKRYGTPKNKELSDSPEWYCRKTVLRRVQKYVPQNNDAARRLLAAMQQDDEIPDAEITPITGDVQPIPTELPRRAPTHQPLDLSAMEEEYGATPVKNSTLVGVPPVNQAFVDSIRDEDVFDVD